MLKGLAALNKVSLWTLLPLSFLLGILIGAMAGQFPYGQICEIRNGQPEQCASYDVFSYSLAKTVSFLEPYGELITAAASIAIAVFTLTLWLITGEAVKLARDEFNATHRPHLIVRNVRSPNYGLGEPVQIKFQVINNGDADAILRASWFEVYLVGQHDRFEFHPIPAVGDPPKQFIPKGTVLIPGEVFRGVHEPGGDWLDAHNRKGAEGQGFYWGGKILYRDKNGSHRRLGVFRKFNPDTKRFRSVKDDEYEYDD